MTHNQSSFCKKIWASHLLSRRPNFWGRHLWDHLIIEIFALGYIELVMGLSNFKFLEHSHWGNFSEITALELDL